MERQTKVKFDQWAVIVNHFEEHPSLLRNKFQDVNANAKNKELWQALITQLNSMGHGCKNLEQCQQAIARWKSKTKAKAAAIRRESTQTGGGVRNTPPLSDNEERLMACLGWKSVTGDTNIELGFATNVGAARSAPAALTVPEPALHTSEPPPLVPIGADENVPAVEAESDESNDPV